MASGVNIFCFTACYFAAWMLELAGLTARYGWHRLVMLAFAGAGSAAQLWYLIDRARQTPAAPLATTFDWCLLAAWILAIVYLGLVFYSPGTSIGLFLLPSSAFLSCAFFLVSLVKGSFIFYYIDISSKLKNKRLAENAEIRSFYRKKLNYHFGRNFYGDRIFYGTQKYSQPIQKLMEIIFMLQLTICFTSMI